MARCRGARFQDMQTAVVEAESSVSRSFAYKNGARRGMQHSKFNQYAVRKKWFWPLIREMAFNPGRWIVTEGGPN
jgi:hypothetical protein